MKGKRRKEKGGKEEEEDNDLRRPDNHVDYRQQGKENDRLTSKWPK